MFRTLRTWRRRRKQNRGRGETSPALDTPQKEADLITLIQSAQSNLPGHPQ
jgi:hypothetical protein